MELGTAPFCPSCHVTAAHYIGLCQYGWVESPSADTGTYLHLDTSLKLRQFKSEYSASQVCSFHLTCCRWGTVQQCRDPHQCHILFQWLWVSQTCRQSIHRGHVGATEQSRGLNQCWPSRQSEDHQDFYCHSAPLGNYGEWRDSYFKSQGKYSTCMCHLNSGPEPPSLGSVPVRGTFGTRPHVKNK